MYQTRIYRKPHLVATKEAIQDNYYDYLDLVILSLEENDNFFHFDVFKNDGQELKKIEYNSTFNQ